MAHGGGVLDPDSVPHSFGLAEDVPTLRSDWHQHRRAQVLYGVEGAMRLHTEHHVALLPPSRAAFLPAGTRHHVTCRRPVRLRTVYLDPHDDDVPFSVFAASPLLASLLVAIAELGPDRPDEAEPLFASVRYLVRDAAGSPLPLRLAVPSSPGLRDLAERVLARPAAPWAVADAAQASGLSVRTLQRRFRAELGIGFRRWLGLARLHHAVDLLADPALEVGDVALRCGYDSPSAFTRAFRQQLGVSPTRWRGP